MFEQTDPRQLVLFPELNSSLALPSITTLPEFDLALHNLIRMSDIGAFIQLKIQGLKKTYSLDIRDLPIPPDFLRTQIPPVPMTVYLFPNPLQNEIGKLVYEIKSFFNHQNSFKTPFGYFLFRPYFKTWMETLEQNRTNLRNQIKNLVSRRQYTTCFLEHFQRGYEYLRSYADITAPWEFQDRIDLPTLQSAREELGTEGHSLQQLDPTDIHYPFAVMLLKTLHVPLKLTQYLDQIQVHAFFKTIHLEYLTDIRIRTIADIRALTEKY